VKLGKTVAEMRSQMDGDEFIHWMMYYARIAQQMQLQQGRR
jgi:hypothetical protein